MTTGHCGVTRNLFLLAGAMAEVIASLWGKVFYYRNLQGFKQGI